MSARNDNRGLPTRDNTAPVNSRWRLAKVGGSPYHGRGSRSSTGANEERAESGGSHSPNDPTDAIEAPRRAPARLAESKNAPMLVNPRTNRRWSNSGRRTSWLRGCKSAGAPRISLFEGTKRSGAAGTLARTNDRTAVRDYLGYTDSRITGEYAEGPAARWSTLRRSEPVFARISRVRENASITG